MDPRQRPLAAQPAGEPPLAGRRLLVVDASPGTRAALCGGLRRCGAASLVEASGVAGGMVLLKEGALDAVVVNADLGHVSGLAFARRLRAHPDPRIADLPCIMVSQIFDHDLEVEQKVLGYTLYLANRFAADLLCRHVLRAIAARPRPADGTCKVPDLVGPAAKKLVPEPRPKTGLFDLFRGRSAPASGRTRARSDAE